MTDIIDHVMLAVFELVMPLNVWVGSNPVLDWGFYLCGVSACTYGLWLASYRWREERDARIVRCVHCHHVRCHMAVVDE